MLLNAGQSFISANRTVVLTTAKQTQHIYYGSMRNICFSPTMMKVKKKTTKWNKSGCHQRQTYDSFKRCVSSCFLQESSNRSKLALSNRAKLALLLAIACCSGLISYVEPFYIKDCQLKDVSGTSMIILHNRNEKLSTDTSKY